MTEHESTRRRFLVAAISMSGVAVSGLGAAVLGAGNAWAQGATAGATSLARLARLLFPHAAIGDAVFLEVIDSALAAAAADPTLDGALDDALAALNGHTEGWSEANAGQQLAALEATQEAPWFTAVHAAVRDRFYNHPAVWEHIGYPGSSVEYGGYVERGFNDIDWLPPEA